MLYNKNGTVIIIITINHNLHNKRILHWRNSRMRRYGYEGTRCFYDEVDDDDEDDDEESEEDEDDDDDDEEEQEVVSESEEVSWG